MDTHLEIRNMKSLEDGPSKFYIARREIEKKKRLNSNPNTLFP